MNNIDLDPVIHAPNRLQICAFLSPLEMAEFQLLRDHLGVSDSVLSKHISKLEQAGYLKQKKHKVGARQRTSLYLTKEGQTAYKNHIAALEAIINGN
ncbi:transcriptional regulator [Pseudemcibacter aquimaris]|uniref:transcriptional regulator n=1 Tax=Pseudemcibacter aquimaris TaxID=2857064 RepID=UPI002010D648|nr:transcriptional regulator [Pseudemcibacter aquimaris]MCC3859595.1 transcriptional regulator [Pseudemcibacter aquimaris]WDU59991.1 transcriptional regulator [Pseudemcibacter aquimaris]